MGADRTPAPDASRGGRVVVPLVVSVQLTADLAGEVDRGVDLDLAVGEAFDVDPERQAEAAAERDEDAGVDGALLVRHRQRVPGSVDLGPQPAGEVDAEPGHELQG